MSESCQVCGGPISRVTLALCDRPEDGMRICRRVVRCGPDGHITWRWMDRPDDQPIHDDSLEFLFK